MRNSGATSHRLSNPRHPTHKGCLLSALCHTTISVQQKQVPFSPFVRECSAHYAKAVVWPLSRRWTVDAPSADLYHLVIGSPHHYGGAGATTDQPQYLARVSGHRWWYHHLLIYLVPPNRADTWLHLASINDEGCLDRRHLTAISN